ncbi:MAG: glutaredoxin family protein [Acidobacteriia bacterium]|nr:glutaredoxin family protein [Terriglobia bacterium]
MRRVILYTRAGCYLCDDAKSVLERARLKIPFAYDEVDIDRDPQLQRLYTDQVPVISIDGVQAFTYRVDLPELLRRLR